MHHDQNLKPNSKIIPIVGEFKNLVSSYLNPNMVKSKIDDQLRKSSFMPKKAVEPEQKIWILLIYCVLSVLVSLERESFIDVCYYADMHLYHALCCYIYRGSPRNGPKLVLLYSWIDHI
jgi:hypothetical protein